MNKATVKEIGETLSKAARLRARPLCVYGSDKVPPGSIPSTAISSCVAEAIVTLAVREKTPSIYVGGDALKNCCSGGTSYLGFTKLSPYIKYFVSYGTKEFRNGAAEYLRATPELAEENSEKIGRITPPGRFVVVKPCSEMTADDPDALSVLFFAEPEQMRVLCALIHFRSADPFEDVQAPSGPSCASFVTYAAGMAEKTPKNAAILGPFDPTSHDWYPPELVSLAIPISLARRMYQDLPSSFLSKRKSVAFPAKRKPVKAPNRLIR